MSRILNRNAIATLSASGQIAKYNGSTVQAYLQGAAFPGTLRATEDGTATVVFDTPGIYFGQDEHEVAGPLNNNFAAQVVDRLIIR